MEDFAILTRMDGDGVGEKLRRTDENQSAQAASSRRADTPDGVHRYAEW